MVEKRKGTMMILETAKRPRTAKRGLLRMVRRRRMEKNQLHLRRRLMRVMLRAERRRVRTSRRRCGSWIEKRIDCHFVL